MPREPNAGKQRYRAVLEVLSGIPVMEVAERRDGPPDGAEVDISTARNTSGDIKRHKASHHQPAAARSNLSL
jgi:hypothetical protein